MKIAVFSDIHSNVFALEAVIADAKARGAGQLLNLGDVLYGPVEPRKTYELLQQHAVITVRGNQDRNICEASERKDGLTEIMEFILNDLGEEPVRWMNALPFDFQLNDAIYLCHATPANDEDYLLENIRTGTPCLRSDSEILASLQGQASPVILCGHTHLPRSVALSSGQLIVNPGSVGLPAYTDELPAVHSMENYSPHASYAILEENKAGWIIQQLKIPYDYQRAVAIAEKRRCAAWARLLATGRRVPAP